MSRQLSLFEVIEAPEPLQYYVHARGWFSHPCPYNNDFFCCIDCRRLGMKAKDCDPCQNIEPAKCQNAKLIRESMEVSHQLTMRI